MIIGIDPSYTGFGIACTSRGKVIFSNRIKPHEKGTYKIDVLFQIIDVIKEEILKIFEEVVLPLEEHINVIIEYPALRTPSGAYLAILMGALKEFITNTFEVNSLVYVPPMACDSFTHNSKHSKTYLVDFVRNRGWVDNRVSHDEATAIVLCAMYSAINKGTYKNSFFKIK